MGYIDERNARRIGSGMADFPAQLTEDAGTIIIAIVDKTYGVTEGDEWERERESFRKSLEQEFELPFEDGDIGPGASLPAFITLLNEQASIPIWTLIGAAFFLGKPISENLAAWSELAAKVKKFFSHRVFLNRNGASVLAVGAAIEQAGGEPTSVKLLGYTTEQVYETSPIADIQVEAIAEPMPTLFLGFVRHIFDIEIDDAIYRIRIDGDEIEIIKRE